MLTPRGRDGRVGGMIALAKPPTCNLSAAQCTVTSLPEPCLLCDLNPPPDPADFTITITGLPEGFTCDVCEQERLKHELIGLMQREGRL